MKIMKAAITRRIIPKTRANGIIVIISIIFEIISTNFHPLSLALI